MSEFIRLSVPISVADAIAARRVREWFTTPHGADLCAGVQTLDVGTLERMQTSVAILHTRLTALMRMATGATTRDFAFTFAVMDTNGDAAASVTVTMPAADCYHAARIVADDVLLRHRDGFPQGARLSTARPTVSLIPV